MQRLFYRLVISCFFGIVSLPVMADAEALKKLQSPDYVLVIRHAMAPGTGDPKGFELGQCETQRNLSATGRNQSLQLGRRLRAAGVSKAHIYTSEWCRCQETAELLSLGSPQKLKAINSFYSDPDPESKQNYTREWRQHLQNKPQDHGRIYVTHQVNLTALLGGFARPGEGYLLKIEENGEIKQVGKIP